MPLYHKDEAYIFSETGQHLETRSLLSDAPKLKFRYNEDSGILEEITNHKQSTVENAILFNIYVHPALYKMHHGCPKWAKHEKNCLAQTPYFLKRVYPLRLSTA